jgi:hypothetical protein
VIEVQVRGDHQIDVVRRESVIGQGVIEVPPPIQAEDVGELGVQLVAHSSVDQDPPRPSPTSQGRVASRMRFRLSGGTLRSQSVLGTTPNMAPPSSAK